MKVACFSVAALDFFPPQNAYYAGGNSLNQAIRFRQMGHPSAFETFHMAETDWAYLRTYDVWATHANSPCFLSTLEHKSRENPKSYVSPRESW